jgi:membrane protein
VIVAASPSRSSKSFADVAKEHVRFLASLFSKAADRFDDLEGFRLGAAFSYYATFAIFPLVLLTVTLVGYVIGDDAATRDRILAEVGTADVSVRMVIAQTLTSMQESHGARGISAVIGLVTLLFSASGAFVELDFALNKVWQVKPRCGKGILGKVSVFLHERLSGFACVAAIGLFMVVSLISSSALGAIAKRADYTLTPALLQTAELTVSIVMLSLVFAAAFHFVPRSKPPFRDVIGGAVLTTVLLTVLKAGFALYLSHLTSYSAYGIVGGVLALATWIYLSSQIIFFGATLTRVHCEMTGCPAAKERDAAERAAEHDATLAPPPPQATAE